MGELNNKIKSAVHIVTIFSILYLFVYFLASISYQLIFDIPADRSRNASWIYYGVMFSTIPYFVIGLGNKFITIKNKNIHIVALYTILTIFITEKIGYVLLASLIANGFPANWYGAVFPYNGFALLSEELPFYSHKYVYYYIFLSTILGYLSFHLGVIFNRYFKSRNK